MIECKWLKFIIEGKLLYFRALVHTKKVPTKNQNATEWQKVEALFDMESNCKLCLYIRSYISYNIVHNYSLSFIRLNCEKKFVVSFIVSLKEMKDVKKSYQM
jgi:hypothetical protein